MRTFLLPQADLVFGEEADIRHVLVLGGRAPEPSWLRRVAESKEVWAVDSGVDACMAAEVIPDHVLGDFDSIGDEARRWIAGLNPDVSVYPEDKDYTDFQLCLQRVEGALLVTGCWGGRFDHTFSNVFSALQNREWNADIRLFADENEILVPMTGNSTLSILPGGKPPFAVSLLPLTAVCEGVSIAGVKWPLNNVLLEQKKPYAVSNVFEEREVFVSQKAGTLGVYLAWGARLR